MLELYLLRQLAAFAEYGTLSEAAARLYLSQPALSRNMRKLEEEIGVPLFVRRRNKLTLNENGELTAALAAKALAEIDSIARQVQEYDRSQRTISLGICAPAPSWRLTPLLSQCCPTMTLQTEIADETVLLQGLHSGRYQLIVLHFQPEQSLYRSAPCGSERLYFSLPRSHPLAGAETLTFADLDGEKLLLMSEIGFWHDMAVHRMPRSRFLIQHDHDTLLEIVSASVLPSFSTDKAREFLGKAPDRIDIPINDPGASVTYFLTCLKEHEKQFAPLFKSL